MQIPEYEQITYNKIPFLKVFLTEAVYPTARHFHEELEILLVLEGELSVTAGVKTYHALPGDFLLFNSYEPHYLESLNHQGLLLVIQVQPGFCTSYFPGLASCIFDCTSVPHTCCPRLLQEAFFLSKAFWLESSSYEFTCMGHLNLLLSLLFATLPHRKIDSIEEQGRSAKIKRLNQILEYVKTHYTEKLLLSQVAAKERLSLHYLSHFFKEQMGISFQEYLKQLRFEKALLLLENTSLNVLDICLECGFSDSRYFYNIFREYFQCTPTEYRKSFLSRQGARPAFIRGREPLPSQIIYGGKRQLSILESCPIFAEFKSDDKGVSP